MIYLDMMSLIITYELSPMPYPDRLSQFLCSHSRILVGLFRALSGSGLGSPGGKIGKKLERYLRVQSDRVCATVD